MQRRHWANEATGIRYADMYDRIQRNNALTKYTTAFDTAQRYVYMLAKVYDYETGLLSSDPQSGDAVMRNIIAARALGESGVTTAQNATLWDAVTRMRSNWDILKGRLGINNPETTTKWFSLRYSLFRIMPGAEGAAAWRDALAFNPDVVIIKLGTNDSKPENWQYSSEFKQDLEQMIFTLRPDLKQYAQMPAKKVQKAMAKAKAKAAKAGKNAPARPQIFLCTPIPAFKSTWNINDSVISNGVIPIQEEVAQKYGLRVIDLHTLFAGDEDKVLPDGIHPNDKGAARMADIIAEYLKQE